MKIPEQLMEMALKAYAESVKQTWKLGGRKPKLYLKTIEQKLLDKAIYDTYLDILTRVYGVVGPQFTLTELAESKGIIIAETGRHMDDPFRVDMEKLIAKSKP